MKRRTLLLAGLGASGALLIGWGVLPPRSRLGNPSTMRAHDGEVAMNGWIKIGADGSVLLAMPRSEMGQGVHTALAMLVADELDVALRQVRLVEAGHDTLYGNVASFVGILPFHPRDREPGHETLLVRSARWTVAKTARELGVNATGGSSSVADAWEPLRLAAATARGSLLGAASLRWKLPVAELTVKDGVVSHPSGPSAHYGELARQAATTPPGDTTLKTPAQWKLIGRAVPRIDVPAKTDGSARFGIDVRLPGMLYAVVRHAPAIEGAPGRVNVDAALKLPGVQRIVRLGPYAGSTAGIAVVARSTWHAKRGADAIDVEWTPRPAGPLSSAAILGSLETAARAAADSGGGLALHSRGDVGQALKDAPRRVEALYRAPYLAHAAMEPINCTAQVKDGKVELWLSTQVPGLARALAARVAGVAEDAVTVHVTYLGGGFGRRLEVDYVGQAVRIALETGGAPVQLVWSREEDIAHDFYRPAAAVLMRAGLDAEGRVGGLAITSAGDQVTPHWFARLDDALPKLVQMSSVPMALLDKTGTEGLFDLPYDVAHQRIAHVATSSGIPVGNWRAVGHSQNAFFAESFIDELAHEARQDPVAFRLGMLKDMPRHAAVLKLAASMAGWGSPLPAGRARGIALHESFGSIVAEVAEVSLLAGKPRVHRVVCAADVGIVVNPGIVAQQMESAVIFALSAALYGRIDVEGSVVKQSNFHDYPMVRLADSPLIETHLVASTRPPSGVGEPGTPPLAPAVANALFVLTGKRLRELPL